MLQKSNGTPHLGSFQSLVDIYQNFPESPDLETQNVSIDSCKYKTPQLSDIVLSVPRLWICLLGHILIYYLPVRS